MNFINNMNFRKSTLLLLLVALTIFVSLSAISATDVNTNDVKDNIELGNVISEVNSIENNNIDENDGIHSEFINNTAEIGGIIHFRPCNILTYDDIQYENILFVDGDSYNLIIEDAPQDMDFSKCRNVTIFPKLTGVTGVVSVPEGYMIVIEGNNLTLKHM